jgi:hypothetical protein
MNVKRIAVTTVSAIGGYTIANMVLNKLNILPAETEFGIGMFEILEAVIITASVVTGNMLV